MRVLKIICSNAQSYDYPSGKDRKIEGIQQSQVIKLASEWLIGSIWKADTVKDKSNHLCSSNLLLLRHVLLKDKVWSRRLM